MRQRENYYIGFSALVCVLSLILMIIVQLPTPLYLNPLGCILAIIWIFSGLYALIGAMFVHEVATDDKADKPGSEIVAWKRKGSGEFGRLGEATSEGLAKWEGKAWKDVGKNND